MHIIDFSQDSATGSSNSVEFKLNSSSLSPSHCFLLFPVSMNSPTVWPAWPNPGRTWGHRLSLIPVSAVKSSRFPPEPFQNLSSFLRSSCRHLWLGPPQSPNGVATSSFTSSTANHPPHSKVAETHLHSWGSNVGAAGLRSSSMCGRLKADGHCLPQSRVCPELQWDSKV